LMAGPNRGRFSIKAEVMIPFMWLIAFSALSLVYTAFFGGFKDYSLLDEVVFLKSNIFESLLLFWLFSSIFQNESNIHKSLLILLVFVGLTNIITVVDTYNIPDLGIIQVKAGHGNTEGAIGEPNQYASYIALFLPPLISSCFSLRGVGRYIMILSTACSFSALLMTASRGGMIAALVGIFILLALWRRELGLARIVFLFLFVAIFLSIAYLALPEQEKETLVWKWNPEVRKELTPEEDYGSGRLDIWKIGGAAFLKSPIVGTGWDTYTYVTRSALKHGFAAHNTYIHYFVTLGLIGGVLFIFILWKIHRILWRVMKKKLTAPETVILRGYAAGFYSLLTAIIFVDLFSPWNFFWIYTGLVMGLSSSILARDDKGEQTYGKFVSNKSKM